MYKLVLAGVVAFIGLIILLMSAVTVEQTERGVLTRFGEVQGTLEPGFHFVNPFTNDVYKMDVSVRALPLTELTYSKDGQIISVNYTVNYQVNSSEVEKIFKEVNNDYEVRYVIPRSKQYLKDVFSKYTAQGVIDNRGVIPAEITALLAADLSGKGITVSNVIIENLDFDDSYEQAIQNKQVQEQQALAQVNITKQEEEKKKQEILKAEALAEKTRLEVQALETSQGGQIIEKIRAEAQLEAAKRWNGVLPVNMYGSAPIPLINL
jgi:regulator of protease activity HflC (stomatin/prohibitin superfamily)